MRKTNDVRITEDTIQLIGLVYDATQDSECWTKLLQHLEDLCLTFDDNLSHSEKLLAPHFQRAVKIHDRLHHLEQENKTSASILNRLPIGILTINRDTTLVASNTRAKLLLDIEGELRLEQGKLTCASKRQDKQLHQCIEECINQHQGKPLQLTSPNTHANTSLWIMPTSHNHDETVVTIYIASSMIHTWCNSEALQQAYQLSKGEAKLVKSLVNGCNNLNEIAEKLQISIHTVRTQIKRVFQKTNTNNQVELVKKVLNSPEFMVCEEQHVEAIKPNKQQPSFPHVRLYDGRILAYHEFGDAKGYPVLYFHCTTGGEFECDYDEETLLRYKIRLISISRPGYGQSSLHNNGADLCFADDVEQLLIKLNITRCGIMGHSSGALNGLICCSKMPDKIKHLTMISPPGLRPNKETMSHSATAPFLRAFIPIALNMPSLLEHSTKLAYKIFGYDLDKFWKKIQPHLCDSDQNEIKKHKHLFKQAFSQGNQNYGVQVAQEMLFWIKPWSFKPSDIRTSITSWRGMKDPFTSELAYQKITQALPQTKTHAIKNEGYYILYKQWENIIRDLSKNLNT